MAAERLREPVAAEFQDIGDQASYFCPLVFPPSIVKTTFFQFFRHSIGWGEDIGYVVAYRLTHQVDCRNFIPSIVLIKPIQQFGVGLLQDLVKGSALPIVPSHLLLLCNWHRELLPPEVSIPVLAISPSNWAMLTSPRKNSLSSAETENMILTPAPNLRWRMFMP